MPNLAFWLFVAFMLVLWCAGGASRADVLGQAVVRTTAWLILIVGALVLAPPKLPSIWPVLLFLSVTIGLVALQLVPLPPDLWSGLPGRALLTGAASVAGFEQPWRPLSISPGATENALFSLVVPAVALLLLGSLADHQQRRILPLLLGFIVASALVGLMQFSGSRFDNPLINDIPGMVSATFANRNHFALFLATGCLLVPPWAFALTPEVRRRAKRTAGWKIPVAFALLLLFALMILATGSRTGAALGVLGTVLGLLMVRNNISRELRQLPRAAAIGVTVALIAVGIAIAVLSVVLNRAAAVDRIFALDASEDLRWQALPVVLDMIGSYFPFGSGFGAFDPVYRIHEPDSLLNIAYFNHVHDDWLEIVLDGGLPGLLLLVAGVFWWLWRSFAAWRDGRNRGILPRLGSAILLLTFLASITDYPARTPIIMALIVIAAFWLNGGTPEESFVQAPRRRPVT